MKAGVVLVGLSTLEAIPLYHLHPGGTALRLVPRPSRSLPCREPRWEICEWMKGPEAFSPVALPPEALPLLLRRWGADVLFLDGFEPWEGGGELVEHAGVTVATRAHGISKPEADYVLLEDVSWLAGENLRERVIRTAEHLHSSSIPFELLAYLPESRAETLGELAEVAGKARALHLFLEPRGGGPERALYEELRRKIPYVYVHAGFFSHLDTYCPHCGALVLSRDGKSLKASDVRGRSCGRCGGELAIEGRARERSSRTLLRLNREGVAWYNPLAFLTFKGVGKKH